MPPTVKALVGRPYATGQTPNYFKLCTPYCVAAALKGGTLAQSDFTPEACARTDVADLATRLAIAADDNPDPNSMGPCSLTLTLRSGQIVEHTVMHALGHPENPMQETERLEKFWLCWGLPQPGPGRAQGETLVARVATLETLGDIAELPTLLRI